MYIKLFHPLTQKMWVTEVADSCSEDIIQFATDALKKKMDQDYQNSLPPQQREIFKLKKRVCPYCDTEKEPKIRVAVVGWGFLSRGIYSQDIFICSGCFNEFTLDSLILKKKSERDLMSFRLQREEEKYYNEDKVS